MFEKLQLTNIGHFLLINNLIIKMVLSTIGFSTHILITSDWNNFFMIFVMSVYSYLAI